MIRLVLAASFVIISGSAAIAQNVPSAAAAQCRPRQADLGGIGRASVVAFTAPVNGTRVCAVVANVAADAFSATLADAAGDAPIAAAVTGGGALTLPLAGVTIAGAGPYVVAPGGVFPSFGDDTTEVPRVVIAFAGQRVLVIATTPIALFDLTRILRGEPDLFDADAVERAVVIASGPQAAISLRTADGTFGAETITTPRVLNMKRF